MEITVAGKAYAEPSFIRGGLFAGTACPAGRNKTRRCGSMFLAPADWVLGYR